MVGYNDEFFNEESSFIKLNELKNNLETDILIIGSGISSLITTYNLQDLGYDICVVDKDNIGNGSTKYNTGIVQYLNDSTLTSMINDDNVSGVKFYKSCLNSVYNIKDMIKSNNIDCDMQVVPCFLCSATNDDNKIIEDEYNTLLKNDFSVSLYNNHELSINGINKELGIKTLDTLLINPYKFTTGLYNVLKEKNTFMKGEYLHHKNNIAYFKNNIEIRYKYIILCMGYNNQDYLSYKHTIKGFSNVIVSDEMDTKDLVYIDTKKPYTYIRPYKNRYIIGGYDVVDHLELNRDFYSNIEALKKDAEDILGIKLNIYKSYSALFYTTNNKLPELVSNNNEFYIYAYGGSGIVYNDIISLVIRNLIGGSL